MRVLVTGLGTFWGSRLALALEQIPEVEVIVGLDTEEPRLPLERTEFVRADSDYSILQRIVKATRVDTILHTHLLVDSTEHGNRRMHEVNVIGTNPLDPDTDHDGQRDGIEGDLTKRVKEALSKGGMSWSAFSTKVIARPRWARFSAAVGEVLGHLEPDEPSTDDHGARRAALRHRRSLWLGLGHVAAHGRVPQEQIGRASCRERV